jgi:SAM-dependent methyltransferase
VEATVLLNSPAWIYETHQVPAIFGPWARVLVDLARPEPGEHVLDAACGTGVVARLVAPMVGQSGKTVGLDFDPMMIAIAKELGPDIEWQQGDLQSLSFADEFFDLVICQQGLQFLPNRDAGLQQIYRVLRPGGRMVLSIWTELAKSPGQAALFGALGALLGKDMSQPPPWSLADGKQVLNLVSAAGFVDVETTVSSLRATYPSARRFVEIHIDGTSKLTRQVLAQVPADRKTAFINDVSERLRDYETSTILELPMESRLLVGRKK